MNTAYHLDQKQDFPAYFIWVKRLYQHDKDMTPLIGAVWGQP
jgi:hypothetical protein